MNTKILILGGVLLGLVIGLSIAVSSCNTVHPGNVGIVVHLSGSDRGEVEVVMPGRHFYNPLTTDVIEYPTYVQTAIWTANENEGSTLNEEITFNSREGLTISADISLSYQLVAARAGEFYAKFRADDLPEFTRGFLRNIARDAFNAIASTYNVEQLYGEKKSEFLQRVKDLVNRQVGVYGIRVEQFGFIGAPRLPESVLAALNAKITATQEAMKSENELRIAQAEAAKEVAVAEGRAKAQIARAEGESKANMAIVASITPQLIEWERLKIMQKWNGVLPMVQGGAGGNGMILQLPMPTTTR
jgi:regulator of protease activity HflC (stomatin/prohibitin superfamily)